VLNLTLHYKKENNVGRKAQTIKWSLLADALLDMVNIDLPLLLFTPCMLGC
jgi:succinylglutamate desuccinylase